MLKYNNYLVCFYRFTIDFSFFRDIIPIVFTVIFIFVVIRFEALMVSDNINDLVARAAKGNDVAFAELIKTYSPLISGEVASFSNCGFDEDDVRQEAYISFYNAVKSFDTNRSTVSFGLYAKICIKNHLLSASRKYLHQLQSIDLGSGSDFVDFDQIKPDPSDVIISRESFYLLQSRINSLLSNYEKSVLHLYISGFSPAEASVILNKGERSVSNALFRIRGKLKGLLSDDN